MSGFIPFVVIGIATGSAYGLAGTGLVLTYKTSGIFNFAYGSIAALAVFVFYWLHTEHGLPWPLAALIVLAVMSPVEGLLLELLARILEPVAVSLKVVATIGLLLVVLGVGSIWYGSGSYVTAFPQFLPSSTIDVGGVYISWSQIIVVIVSVLATATLYWFFRFVRMGIGMRGLVDNPSLLAMTGEKPVRLRRWAWVIGTVFASAAGLLLAPTLSIDALVITMLIVQAFGAAAVGYFSSLPLTFAGGLVIGIGASLATKYVASVSWLSGLPAGLPFILLFVVLIVTPRAKLVERRVTQARPVRRSWRAPVRVRVLGGLAVLAVLAFVPQMVGADLPIWSEFLIGVVLFGSLGFLVRTSGQISLCHLAFAAAGAAAFSHLMGDWHVPWLAAVLLAGLITVPVGAIIAIPAIRLSGVFLALATLGFGVLLEQMVYQTGLMFGPTTVGLPASRPDFQIGAWNLGSDSGFYYVLLIFAALTTVLLMIAQRGRIGRLLRGLADAPLALETHGTSTNVTRVLVFCISAGLAGVAGALTASLFHYAVGSDYSSFNSLELLALLVIIVPGEPWYALLASLGYMVIPGYLTVPNISNYLEIVFGAFAATYALQESRMPGVPAAVRNLFDRLGELLGDRGSQSSIVTALGDGAGAGRPRHAVAAGPGIEVRDLAVHFGGVKAVQDVSFAAPTQRITGLVGPNGAGKTTTFNACSGLVRPTAGRVLLHSADITRRSTSARSRLGLGRTFQRPDLFSSLTVEENVALGSEASMAGARPLRQLVTRRRERDQTAHATRAAMELVGVSDLATMQAGLLSTGQKRMVELARALAGPFDVLLLDEPSAGLDAAETRRFGQVLRNVVEELGTGILLVEHDMALVREVCEYVYVIDFGQLIFEGTAEEMTSSVVVRAAYLGAEGSEHAGAAAQEVEAGWQRSPDLTDEARPS